MLYTFVERAGVMMIPVLACSVLSLAIVLERVWFWFRLGMDRDPRLREDLLRGRIRKDRLERTADPLGRVLRVFLMTRSTERAEGLAKHLVAESRWNLRLLEVIASVSTSFGLLGTVVGVSMAFRALARVEDIANGLAVALHTTIGGLVVFLLSYIMGSFFSGLSEKLALELGDLLKQSATPRAGKST